MTKTFLGHSYHVPPLILNNTPIVETSLTPLAIATYSMNPKIEFSSSCAPIRFIFHFIKRINYTQSRSVKACWIGNASCASLRYRSGQLSPILILLDGSHSRQEESAIRMSDRTVKLIFVTTDETTCLKLRSARLGAERSNT